MFVLVSYDVATKDSGGARRLRRVAKACQNFGQRVQYSVFECIVDPAQWAVLRQGLIDVIDPEKDSLRFYFWGQIGSIVWNILEPKNRWIKRDRSLSKSFRVPEADIFSRGVRNRYNIMKL
jgi:CRISPR-associated protein, Cas2 family